MWRETDRLKERNKLQENKTFKIFVEIHKMIDGVYIYICSNIQIYIKQGGLSFVIHNKLFSFNLFPVDKNISDRQFIII